jgi:FkbM family methyltransferase
MISSLSSGDLTTALAVLGRDEEARRRVIRELQEYEERQRPWKVNVREDITGPIVDALHASVPTVSRTLASGLRIKCPYRSKIARDFAMAPERPDHVWEPQTTKLLLHLASQSSHILIGGAYFGDQALPVAQVMQPRGGWVHCFEANADQLDALIKNAKCNALTNMTFHQVGLWSEAGQLLVLDENDAHAAVRPANADPQSRAVRTRTIDDYCAAAHIAKLDVIMLDIEGAELQALQGAKGQLGCTSERGPVIIFEIHRRYVDWSEGLHKVPIVRFLADRGYEIFALRDYQGNYHWGDIPIELVVLRNAYLEGPPHGFNMIAVKDPKIINDPLFRIRRGVSPKLLFHRAPHLHQPLPD